MNNQAIAGQYHASLQMLRTALETCTDDLWDASVGRHPFWLIGYHALYYTDLYLAGSLDAFEAPAFGRENEQYMEKLPDPPHDAIEIGEPYKREDLLAWCDRCRKQVDDVVLGETEESLATEANFEWIPFSRLELHFYNLSLIHI